MWRGMDKRGLVKAELRRAAKDSYDRGLYQSAQWSNEHARAIHCPTPCPFSAPQYDPQFQEEYDLYMAAMVTFQNREYNRTQWMLKGTTSNICRFVRAYSSYLEGARVLEEETPDLLGGTGAEQSANKSLQPLRLEMQNWDTQRPMDGFELWLYGVIQKELGNREAAKALFVKAVGVYPAHFAPWEELVSMVETVEEAESLGLPEHFMKDFFLAHLKLELVHSEDAIEHYLSLQEVFPDSCYVLSQMAVAHYNSRDFDPAQSIFEEIRKRDPLRLEGMDMYSNILYVKGLKAELSVLAHAAYEIDKYRPETCCIVGNYYSNRQDHKKAVVYFQRALRLDRRYLVAWTLMGHEYIEMKNTPDAIEAYRRAMDINPREFRAVYGLGQAYEILHMYTHAAYYYNIACTLRQTDGRMWTALGNIYKHLGKVTDAINCFQRAAQDASQRGSALFELAQLYEEKKDNAQAAANYMRYIHHCQEQEMDDDQNMVRAYLYLARHLKDVGRYADAEHFAARVCQYSGREKEEAKELLLQLRVPPRQGGVPRTPWARQGLGHVAQTPSRGGDSSSMSLTLDDVDD